MYTKCTENEKSYSTLQHYLIPIILQNEKILKAREKMLAKRAEQSQNVEKDLQDKRYAAQLKREKIFQDKLERIKKHVSR